MGFFKKSKIVVLIFFLFNIFPKKGFCQQPFSYTQYIINPIPFNPAFALVDQDTKAEVMIRKQWAGIHGAPTTQFADGFMPLEKTNGAVGFIFENDKIGVEGLSQFNAFYSQTVQVGGQNFLGLSLNLGFRNYVANYSSLLTSDPSLTQDVIYTKPNLGFGLLYFSKDFYVGISAPQFTFKSSGNSTSSQNNNFKNDYFMTAGVTDNLYDDLKIQFASLITYTGGVGVTTDISSVFLYKELFGIGLNYRTNNEVALIISTKYRSFNFGYSYQFGLNSDTNIGSLSNATQELTISYSLGHKRFYVKKGGRVF